MAGYVGSKHAGVAGRLGMGFWSRRGEGWVRRASGRFQDLVLEGAVLLSLRPSPLISLKRRNHLSGEDGEPQGENDFSLNWG